MPISKSKKQAEQLALLAMKELEQWTKLEEKFGVLRQAGEGTVVRYRRQFSPSGLNYLYVAIYIGNKWYLTSQNIRMSMDDFIQLLGSTEVSEVKFVQTWSPIEDW